MDSKAGHIVELGLMQLAQQAGRVDHSLLAVYPPIFPEEGKRPPGVAGQWTIETVDYDGQVFEHHGDTLAAACQSMIEYPAGNGRWRD